MTRTARKIHVCPCLNYESNRTVYRSCSELGGKKMIWVVEKYLEDDIVDLSV